MLEAGNTLVAIDPLGGAVQVETRVDSACSITVPQTFQPPFQRPFRNRSSNRPSNRATKLKVVLNAPDYSVFLPSRTIR